MKLTRRDVLRFAGGSILGTLFTPVPWKLLDDSSIWSQNWSLIPKLSHGALTSRATFCTLCPAGCAAQARCVASVPFALDSVPAHPLGGRALCPVGLAAHHLAYHPLRLDGPKAFSGKAADSQLAPIALQDAIARIHAALASASATGGVVAVLDQRPGRALSALYQQFLATYPSRTYIVPPAGADETIAALAELSNATMPDAGFDLEHARTVVSFGAPVLDGWGQPGRVQAAFAERASQGRKLIQIESHRSRTAAGADAWLPVRPGTEAAVALSIANVIIREGLHTANVERTFPDFKAYSELVMQYHPHPVSALAGIAPDAIVQTARALAAGPSIALSGGEAAAGPLPHATRMIIASLNLLCGNVGREGGIVYRQEATRTAVPATRLQDVPDHSIRVLLMDAAESGDTFPQALLEQKLVPERSLVVLLAPTLNSRSSMADILIPTGAAFEGWEEAATAAGAATMSYAVASPILPPVGTPADPVEFLTAITGSFDGGVKTMEGLLRRKADELFASKRGTMVAVDGATRTPVASVAASEEVWRTLVAGGCWLGEAPTVKQGSVRFALMPAGLEAAVSEATRPMKSDGKGVVLEPFGMRAALCTGTVSPIMSKIFQESNLRAPGGTLLLNPATASAMSIADRSIVRISTARGSVKAQLLIDASVMPGVARVAVGPLPNRTPVTEELGMSAVLGLCDLRTDGTWRYTDATIEKV
jgi:menaquinone reductase, molybdopterin-binding-like subunit